jgi:hypothetical protein
MTTHQYALQWAREHLGEHEVPMGSNTGPFVLSCQRATWLGGTRWPWCVAFWVKAWTVAGRTLPYRGAGAYAMLDWYRKHLPTWVVAASHARTGSAVIFNIGAGLCAILARPYPETDPWVHTVDGNVGDKVSINKRHITTVRGVIDPPEKMVGVVRPAKPPVFEVVTSASGHTKLVYASGPTAIGKKLPQILNRYGGVTIRRRKSPK